jgi:DNA-binding transcriptional LysR family regulator
VVYAAANHRLAKRKRLTLADLVQERWMTGAINNPGWRRLCQAFADNDLPPPKTGVETTYLTLRNELVAATDLLAFASREVARYAAARLHIAELRVKDLTYTRRVGLMYRKDAYLSPAARQFIEILKSTAKEIAAENR